MNDAAATSPDIAIVGMACRLPGANDVQTFWDNLRTGVESVRRYSDSELDALNVSESRRSHPDFRPFGALIDGVDGFDTAFWGYSPREAAFLDPQQRLFLEVSWEAFESAGYDPLSFDRPVGVYAASGLSAYLLENLLGNRELTGADKQLAILGNDKDFLSSRVAYHLDLRGPSIGVQSGCSGSLVATHLATRALSGGECDVALVGGVSVEPPHRTGYHWARGSTASPDGHTRTFDKGANGTVFGNGVGAVVLKRLADARADRDCVYAVIKGSAVNNDGRDRAGFVAPSVSGQADVIRRAHAVAGISAETVSYVELHGTATPVGDPIEFAALSRAFSVAGSNPRRSCAVGSVKTNVGHLDAAAGVTGLIKTALALWHRELPPSLNFEEPNPEIQLEGSPFYVNTSLESWECAEGPRRAGVSAFGFGGTNAHVVLEESPDVRLPRDRPRRPEIVVLSAKTPTALAVARERLANALSAGPEDELADVAFTTQVGRHPMRYRMVVECTDRQSAVDGLLDSRREALVTDTSNDDFDTTFLFPGLGSHFVGMGDDLYFDEPSFRAAFDECSALVREISNVDLRGLLGYAPAASGRRAQPLSGEFDFAAMMSGAGPDDTLQRSVLAHLALFAVEYSAARMWMSWGVRPAALVGHSLGEYVAATIAEVYTLKDALTLLTVRAEALRDLPDARLVSVDASESDVRELIGSDDVFVALKNAQDTTVVGGHVDAMRGFLERVGSRDIQFSPLSSTRAYHTPLCQPVVAPLRDALERIRLSTPKIDLVSGTSGTWMTDTEATSVDYWAQHIVSAIDFASVSDTVLSDLHPACVELGPGVSVGAMITDHATHRGLAVFPPQTTMRAWYDERDDNLTIARRSLGRLWSAGTDVAWGGVHDADVSRRVMVPTYPFERRRAWVDVAERRDRGDAPIGPYSAHATDTPPDSAREGVDSRFAGSVQDRPDLDVAFSAPRDANEATVQEEFGRLLGLRGVGRDDNFYALGGQSLLATQLVNAVSGSFGVSLSVATFLKNPTVAGLADAVRREHSGEPSTPARAAIVRRPSPTTGELLKPLTRVDDGVVRLLCAPGTGAGAGSFRGLVNSLPARVEVYVLHLPGREERAFEQPQDDIGVVVHQLQEELAQLPSLPLALLGHSTGAAILWEFARAAESAAPNAVDHLFVAACRPPAAGAPKRELHKLPDLELMEHLKSGGLSSIFADDERLMDLVMPTIRADLKLADTVDWDTGQLMSCDVSALAGRGDELVSVAEMSAWHAATTGRFDLRVFEGGHDFVETVPGAVAGSIAEGLRSLVRESW